MGSCTHNRVGHRTLYCSSRLRDNDRSHAQIELSWRAQARRGGCCPSSQQLNIMETSSRNLNMDSGKHQQHVASIAFSLWEKAGRPQGRDEEFWFEAEKVLAKQSPKTERSQQNVPSSQTLNRASAEPAPAPRAQNAPREQNGDSASRSDRAPARDKRTALR